MQSANLTRTFSRQRPIAWAGVITLLTLAGIIWADWMVGHIKPGFTISSFYLIPVCVAAWWIGPVTGTAVAVLGIAARLVVRFHSNEPLSPPGALALYSNAALRMVLYTGIAWAISAWRNVGRLLETMVAQRTDALRNLAADLSAAEDAQRRQLAHDLHDALGQNLSLLRIHLESIARDVKGSANDAASRLSTEVARINSLIQQTRTLVFDLYPPMLDDLGFAAALEGYADEFTRRMGTEVTISQDGESPCTLEKSVAHYLFRAVREMLANAVNHGHAKQVVIGLHWAPSSLRLTVDDDGEGFDSPPATQAGPARRGLGLTAIRERLNAMGGAMEMESRAGQGTRVILQLPLESADAVPSARPGHLK
jgi:signal transduction histidine kinase